jgi:hypothetical protein
MNNFKLLILSADPTILSWETLPVKLSALKAALKVFDVDVKYEAHSPIILNDRIFPLWLNSIIKPHFDKGYDIVAFHFSKQQCKKWGIKGINGSNPTTDDEMGDLYFWSDEDTKRQGLSQFVQTCLHEISHEYLIETKQKDITHEYHAPLGKHADITPLVLSFDWNLYQPHRMELKAKVPLLKQIISLLTEKNRLERLVALVVGNKAVLTPPRALYPLFDKTIPISQAYGVANSEWYPLTGHHLGTDWATPVGTPVYAPTDCEVTRVGFLKDSLGHWGEVKIDNWYMILCHLNHTPDSGKLKKGYLIGYTGNTGFTKGAHCHVEGWRQPMDRSKLSKTTWDKLTFDVTSKFK